MVANNNDATKYICTYFVFEFLTLQSTYEHAILLKFAKLSVKFEI